MGAGHWREREQTTCADQRADQHVNGNAFYSPETSLHQTPPTEA
jgi:hypothetical protein